MFLQELLCNFLLFFMHASSTLPLLAICALLLYRKNLQAPWFSLGKLLVSISLVFALLGVIGVFAEPLLLYAKLHIQGLAPRIPGLFEDGIVPYTLCALCRCVGIIHLLLALRILNKTKCNAAWNNAHIGTCLLLTLSAFLFFISYVVQMWPSGAFPEGLTFSQILLLLVQQALHQYVAALAPAGICVLCLFCSGKLQRRAGIAEDHENSAVPFVRWASVWSCVGLLPGGLVILGHFFASLLQHIQQKGVFIYGQAFLVLTSLACFALLLFPRLGRLLWLRITAIIAYFLYMNLRLLIEVCAYGIL